VKEFRANGMEGVRIQRGNVVGKVEGKEEVVYKGKE